MDCIRMSLWQFIPLDSLAWEWGYLQMHSSCNCNLYTNKQTTCLICLSEPKLWFSKYTNTNCHGIMSSSLKACQIYKVTALYCFLLPVSSSEFRMLSEELACRDWLSAANFNGDSIMVSITTFYITQRGQDWLFETIQKYTKWYRWDNDGAIERAD